MKMVKSLWGLAMMAFMGASVWAANVNVNLVEGAKTNVTSSATVSANYYYKYVLGSGADTYVETTGTSATQNGSSAKRVTATFTGKKITTDSTSITLQQASSSNGSYSTRDTYTVYVAQTNTVVAKVGGGTVTISTPTISTAANWALNVANTSIATATIQTGSAKSRTITITPKAAGVTTIDVCSGSSSYSANNPLRQRITVVVPEIWTQTFQMPTCSDYFGGSGVEGAEIHKFTKLTTNPSGYWILTSEGLPADYIGISANKAAAQPTLQFWPTVPGYVFGTIVDPGNASNYAEFGITLTYQKEENVPLLTSGRTSVQKTCSYSGVYKDETDGTWTVTSTDASVAAVEGVNGHNADAEIHPVITALRAGTTTVTVKNSYATYIYHVVASDPMERPVDIVITNEVRIANGVSLVLTNDVGTAIAWNSITDTPSSSDENIAKIIQLDGLVAVSNTLYDGASQVDVEVPGTNYHFIVRSLSIGIEKTVRPESDTDPNNKSNATVRITAHVLHGVNTVQTNGILFLSSVCTSHNLASATIVTALNTLKEKGNVDWFLYGKLQDEAQEEVVKGTLEYEGPDITTAAFGNVFGKTRHSNLRTYLRQLDESLDYAHMNYAYVVLSFDGTRLASYLTNDDPDLDRRVAEKLRWYYENNRVFWIVDSKLQGSPYDNVYYRPNSAISSNGWCIDQEAWEALVAMLDPATYLANSPGSRYTETTQDAGVDVWAARRHPLQVPYDNADQVQGFLEQFVHVAQYDVSIDDKILNLNESLSIVPRGEGQKVYLYRWAGNGSPEATQGQTIADLPNDDSNWKLESASVCTVDGYQIHAAISDIRKESWVKIEINIEDNGTFLKECLKHDPPLATYDPDTGKYSVNPNDGPARATVTATESYGGSSSVTRATATGETSMEWEWKMKPRPLSLWITDHADAGSNRVHLAFQPIFDKEGNMSDWIPFAQRNDLVRYVEADTEAELTRAPFHPVSFREGTGLQDVQKGWCWITVPSANTNKLHKIVILDPQAEAN